MNELFFLLFLRRKLMEEKFRIFLLLEYELSMSLTPKEVAFRCSAENVTFLPIESQNCSKNMYSINLHSSQISEFIM
jgi:hypothetical protein